MGAEVDAHRAYAAVLGIHAGLIGAAREDSPGAERTSGSEEALASRVVLSSSGSRSLRVTIPQVIASMLGLQAGDDLVWSVTPEGSEVRVRRRPGAPEFPATEPRLGPSG